MVPEGWKKARVRDVCHSVSVGIVVKPTQYYVPEGQGVRAFRSANVREGYVEDKDWVFISHEGDELNKKSRLQEGDVLVVRTGYPGTACVVPAEFVGSNAIDIVFARPNRDLVVPEYLSLFTNSDYGKRQISNAQGGLAQKHLNVGAYKNLFIPLPPKKEQKSIVEKVYAWNGATTLVRELIVNATAQKSALMQQLLTGNRRLPEFDAPWEEEEVGELLQEVTREVDWNDAATYNLLSVRRRSGGLFLRESRKGSEILTKKMNVAKAGDFLISKMQVVHGATALVTDQFDGMHISGSYIALRSRSENKLDIRFIDWLSKMKRFYHQTYLCSYGVHIEKMTFSLKLFLKEKVALPTDMKEQAAIVEVLRCAESQIVQYEEQLDRLQEEKKALMQQLLTGKRRVKIDREAA